MEKENDNVMIVNKESGIEKYETDNIKNLIYTIRGKQVMLDSDVAMLYHYETKKINQTVKRNIERFPKKFCFQLTEDEIEYDLKRGNAFIKYGNLSEKSKFLIDSFFLGVCSIADFYPRHVRIV